MTPNPGETPQNSLLGAVLGDRYRILQLLGEGGMGSVYLGEQKLGATVRKVAIKTLHPHLSHDPKILARFERECGTVAELQHPNTIQVYDFGKTDDGTLYIVMEYVEGRSVADVLEKDGPMDPGRVDRILTQICGSLQEAHSRGIIHRDLKPENVVLCERAGQKDWVEVLDFGIAKRSAEEDRDEQKLTQQGMVLGTPPYMSPEQFTGRPVDARSDIYSLGVMAYEMLTARLPFHGNTAWEWATQHMTAAPVPLESLPQGAQVPERMRHAIARALAKRPEDRFSNIREFLDAFCGNTPAAGAGHANAVVIPGDPRRAGYAPSSGGEFSRGKTEIGAPMDIPAATYGAPPPMGPPGTPPYGMQPGAAVPAFAPPPPRRQNSGGGRKALIIAAAIIGLLSIAAIGLAIGRGRTSPAAAIDLTGLDAASTPEVNLTAGAASNSGPTAADTTAAVDAPLATLTRTGAAQPHSGGTSATTAHKDAGAAVAPTVPPVPSTPPTTVPPPTAPTPVKTTPTVPAGPEPSECRAARIMRDRNRPVEFENLKRICLSKGGSI